MATAKEAAGNGSHDANSSMGETMTDAIDDMASAIGDPAEWPEMAEDLARSGYKELTRGGWWPAVYAAGGSLATLIGAIVVARRKAAKHNGLMAAAMPIMAAAKPMIAAMPSQFAEASEQMMRKRTKSGAGWMRTLMAIGLFAATGWGIRRAMAQAS